MPKLHFRPAPDVVDEGHIHVKCCCAICLFGMKKVATQQHHR